MVLDVQGRDKNQCKKLIRKIGSGSFSNVYLCQYEVIDTIEIQGENWLNDGYFITKEIDLNALVRQYQGKVSEQSGEKCKTKCELSITPYDKGQPMRTDENEYYYKRLEDLINTEIEVIGTLHHKNIIAYYDHSISSDVYRLEIEYCDMGDVHDILKNKSNIYQLARNTYGGMGVSFVQHFLSNVLDGLLCIHNHQIIHRDIKLHNILMKKCPNGYEFKISDFGFACLDRASVAGNGGWSDSLGEKYFKVCGTPYYMAPELLSKVKNKLRTQFYSKKVDMWSLGVCLFELVFNRLPFPRCKSVKELDHFFSCSPQSYIDNIINNASSDIPSNILQIIGMLLKVNPMLRASVEEVHMHFHATTAQENKTYSINSGTSIDVHNSVHKTEVKKGQDLSTSWEQVSRSSIETGIRVKRPFWEWLFRTS